jgi:hypothetical protein
MPISIGTGMALMGGASLLGGYLQGESAKGAAESIGQANLEAARLGANAARFRPIGLVGLRYAKEPQYEYDAQGNLIRATIAPSDALRAMQERVDALTGAGLGYAEQAPSLYAPLLSGAQTLFGQAGLGLKATPEQQAADWMAKQQALIAPQREQAWANLANTQQNTGTTGLKVAQGGGLLSANPQASALANAQALQDLQLAAQATQAGQQMANFYANQYGQGGGLLSQYGQGLTGGYAPFSAGIGVGQTLENIAQAPLAIGSELGGRTATAGANIGRLAMAGTEAASPYLFRAGSYNPYANVLQGFGTNPYLMAGTAKLFGGGDRYLLGQNPWGMSGNEPIGGFSQSGAEYFAG